MGRTILEMGRTILEMGRTIFGMGRTMSVTDRYFKTCLRPVEETSQNWEGGGGGGGGLVGQNFEILIFSFIRLKSEVLTENASWQVIIMSSECNFSKVGRQSIEKYVNKTA